MSILPTVLAGASILRTVDPGVSVTTGTDRSAPLWELEQKANPDTLTYPGDIRRDDFYTIFRVYERTANFEKGRLNVGNNNNKLGEILLPLPPNLGTAYSVDYGQESLGAFGSTIAGATEAAKPFIAVGDYGGAAVEAAGKIGDAMLDGKELFSEEGFKALLKNAGLLAAREIIPNSVGVGLNIAKNPYQAVVFNSPKFRTHSFSYNLFARNRDESFTIQGIINLLKESMMPEFPTNTGLYLKYPKVFEIEYHAGNADNPFVHRISTSALTDFSIDYHGEGTPAYFDAELSPAPTSIKINMTFQELNFMTAEMVRMGY
jgi:hypothetical protein